jgi:hypothetical protein
MKQRTLVTTAAAAVALAVLFAGPASAPVPLGPDGAAAAVSKSLDSSGGGGGGNVAGAGKRLGELLSGWAVPVLIVLGGCLLLGALTARNIGASLGIVVVTLVGLIFLLSPSSIETLAKRVANVVF